MHYYKRNIGDYHKKAGRLSMLQHGAYTLLIDSCYDREQFPTMDQAIEWTWASTEEEVQAVRFVLSRFFDEVDGIYIQKRIQEDLDKYHQNSATNKRIAIEREAKRREKSTKREQVVDEAPPNHKPITNNHKPRTNNQNNKPVGFDFTTWPNQPSEEVWKDFVKHRNAKKAKISQTVINRMSNNLHEVALTGWSVDDVLSEICERGWTSFKPDWLNGKTRYPNQQVSYQERAAQVQQGFLSDDPIEGHFTHE